jgi:hypothetical protein
MVADEQRLIFSFSIWLLVIGWSDEPWFPPQHKALKRWPQCEQTLTAL